MFAYLSKKVGIPNNTRVECIAWSSEQGWIACGGEKGLLKILKLEDPKQLNALNNSSQVQPNLSTQTTQNSQGQLNTGGAGAGAGVPGAGGLPVNQTLEGHSGTVKCVIWNDAYRKLTTSDENGLIIVWMLHKSFWFEEMINNRNKSIVMDMKWSPDGTRICIIYEDGNVILGSVEGSRLWGKELKHKLSLIEWSPDGKLMLFGTPEGEVRVYDNTGNPIHQLKIYCLQKLVDPQKLFTPNMKIVALQWYEGSKMYTEDTPPGLVFAYECGRIQLMKNDKDDDPTLIDTNLNVITSVRWNSIGTIFAVSGIKKIIILSVISSKNIYEICFSQDL